MSRRKIFFLVVLVLVCGVSRARAQRQFEITPFGGSRFGGVIDVNTPSVDFLTIKSAWNYGVIGNVSLFPNLEGEFMWNRQATMLGAHDIASNTFSNLTKANLDLYQFSALYELRQPEARLKPFFVAGVGFTHIASHGALDFSNRFAYNFGVGAKYFFTRHLGLRLEGRWSPTRTTSSNVVVCDPFLGCFLTRVPNHAQQGQANLGLIFRF